MGIEEDDNPFLGFIGDRRDEKDDWSPCSVWLNKRYGCDADGKYSLLTEDNYDNFVFPAPFSVGIFFDVEPTESQINLIKERAVKFFKDYLKSKEVKIEGFRKILHAKYAEEKDL